MAIISATGLTMVVGNDGALQYLLHIKTHLVSAGWTVARSSDGTTAGAGDNISVFGDLSQYNAGVSESWMVLADPGGGRELLWSRGNATDSQWVLEVSPAAGFTGGAITGPPTATDSQVWHILDAIKSSAISVLQITADNAAPYGWAAYAHTSGNFSTANGGYAMIPIDVAAAGETDQMVYFYDGGGVGHRESEFSDETGVTSNGQVQAIMPGTTTMATCPGLSYASGSSGTITCFPHDAPADDSSNDVSAPILFGRRAGLAGPNRIKGFSSFAQWNGVTRAPGETFASQTRVSLGDVNYPWNGSTTPVDS